MKRILFVDDDSNVLSGIRRMLYADRQRWEIRVAEGAEAALAEFAVDSIDVVVSDLRMPGMDGAAFLREVRDRYPHTIRIVLSGYSEQELTHRAVAVAQRYLQKPVDPEEIRSVLEQVCQLSDLINSPEVKAIVGSINELPSLSSTYASLMRVLDSEKATLQRIAEIIQHDAGMSAKLLQLVNSAFFGLARQVTDIAAGVAYLGLNTVRTLALNCEVFRVFVPDARIPSGVCEAMQKHALNSAQLIAAMPIDGRIREMATVAALLQDVGGLFLAYAMPKVFLETRTRARENGAKVYAEEYETLGATHAEIGAYLLGLWGIPYQAVEAIAHHNEASRVTHRDWNCVTALYLANSLLDEAVREARPDDPFLSEFPACNQIDSLRTLPWLDEIRAAARVAVAS